MKAELRRALTTRHRGPPPRAQSRSGEGSACLRPLQSLPAGPKDARWNDGGASGDEESPISGGAVARRRGAPASPPPHTI
eukprot:scaffold12948_cov51-Phaeocystis_antarctica.AAC.1